MHLVNTCRAGICEVWRTIISENIMTYLMMIDIYFEKLIASTRAEYLNYSILIRNAINLIGFPFGVPI